MYYLKDKIRFLRYLSYGCSKEQAWVQTFGYEMTPEALAELVNDEDFQVLQNKYKDELRATGDTRDEIMMELDALNEEAAQVVADSERVSERLESIKVRQKGVEMKAKISKKMSDKAEINLSVGMAVATDDELLRIMEQRAQKSLMKQTDNDTIEAEYEEVK